MPRLERLFATLALICLPAPLFAVAELEARIWRPSIDGDLRVVEGSTGTDIRLPDDLGFDDETATEVRLTWRLPGPLVVRFGFLPLSYGGTTTVSDEIEFGGVTFPVDFDLRSDLDLDYGRLGIGWMFRAGGRLRIGPMFELKAVRAEAELEGSVLSIPLVSARESEEAAFAAAGVAFEAKPIPTVRIVGEASYSPALEYGELLEAELGVRFSPVKILSVFAGYRLIDLDLEADDDRLDLELAGPYVGASLSF